MRPVALLALGESEENFKFLMDTTINSRTKLLNSTGVELPTGVVNIDITQCLFVTKMAAILDGLGGEACHLCIATREQIKDVQFVKHGFPINRFIDSAIQIFTEVDIDEFLTLPTKDRFGLAHEPTSEENIIPASPLQDYPRI